MFEFVKVSSPFLVNYLAQLSDLVEFHLERRDHIAILNLELWEVIGSDHAEKMATIRDRIG